MLFTMRYQHDALFYSLHCLYFIVHDKSVTILNILTNNIINHHCCRLFVNF